MNNVYLWYLLDIWILRNRYCKIYYKDSWIKKYARAGLGSLSMWRATWLLNVLWGSDIQFAWRSIIPPCHQMVCTIQIPVVLISELLPEVSQRERYSTVAHQGTRHAVRIELGSIFAACYIAVHPHMATDGATSPYLHVCACRMHWRMARCTVWTGLYGAVYTVTCMHADFVDVCNVYASNARSKTHL